MNFRNAEYSTINHSMINCEIEHPEFGWIPTTIAVEGDDRPELVEAVLAGEIADYVVPVLTAEQVAMEAAHVRANDMLKGVEYNGVMASLTSEDGNGVIQVKNAFEMGLTETNIHFENGTILPMTAADFPAFALWFVTERNKFF